MFIPLYKKQMLACAVAGAIALFGFVGGLVEPVDVETAGQEAQAAQMLNVDQGIESTGFQLDNI